MKPLAIFLNDSADNRLADAFDEPTRARLRRGLQLADRVYLPQDLPAERQALADTAYIFSTWGMPALQQEQLAAWFPRLRAVFYAAGTVQGFARPFLAAGVRVFSAWAANAVPVAEYAVSQILLANKGFFQAARMIRQQPGAAGRAAAAAYCGAFCGNYRVRVGILGAGMIGSLVLQKLRDCQLETLTYDPFASDEKLAALGTRRATLEEIFATCQTVSCHIANLPETQRMLQYRHFCRMGTTATFINTGRGAQVAEEDLIRALTEQPGRTALLDVTWPEPPAEDSPLWRLPNVFLTPHIAGSINQEIARMGVYMAEEYENLATGRPCRYEVTEDMLRTMA